MPRLTSGAIVGIDFDNTIISYDHLILAAAIRQDLVSEDAVANKKTLRDAIRLLPNGEVHWQKIQAEVYGPEIAGAELIAGVSQFLTRCGVAGVKLYIVSHKTTVANYDTTNTNLRDAAMAWIESRDLFSKSGGSLVSEQVNFAMTLEEKVARIETLGCSYFIDDLTEVFDHPQFPSGVEKMLLDRSRPASAPTSGAFANWYDITDYLFGDD